MTIYEHTTETANYSPVLNFPIVSGVTIVVAGSTISTSLTIPMTLTTYAGPNRKATVSDVTLMPAIDEGSNLAFGGHVGGYGNDQLPKITLEGFIDTPVTALIDAGADTNDPHKNLTVWDLTVNGLRQTYADIIAMYFEGRASTPTWKRINPNWFIDPYGRQFNNPKIMDFNATYIEGVPRRTNFSMQLVV